MKRKITAIFLSAAVIFGIGTAVAYYNTKTFGFDESATVFSKDDEKFTFLDFDVYYEDIESFFTSAEKYMPPQFTTVDIELAGTSLK